MVAERKTINSKTRFEVFKRDGFTCQYCGRKTPNVVLEVDHVVPVAEGGTNDMENLVTSCYECNRGKGKGLLDDRAPVPDVHEQTVLMLERELQLREYNQLKEQIRAREDDDIAELLKYWDDLAGGHARRFPEESSLRMFLRHIPREDIKDAMDKAMARAGDWGGVTYLYAVLHAWRKERAGIEED